MNIRVHLAWVCGIGFCSVLSAGTGMPSLDDMETVCAQRTRPSDVLVLNLEHLRFQPDEAQDFVVGNTGGYRLLDTRPEEIITRSRISKDPQRFTRKARKLGAKRGCNLVVVLKTGPYFGRQRNINGKARIRDQGYALVVMGERANR